MAEEFPSLSPRQFQHLANGQVRLVGRPDVTLKLVGEKASAVVPEWERQLGMPVYQEECEAAAVARGSSSRFVQFVLCDQSRTKFIGNWRFQPARIRLRPGWYRVTLGHTGFIIGKCYALTLHPKETPRGSWKPPDFVEGDCLIGYAQLYAAPLADLAARGLRAHIFSHACAVVAQEPDELDGAGELDEIALVSEAEAGCPVARVLKWWEAS